MRFDATLGAWILTRYEDVRAALRDPRLAVGAVPDNGAHRVVRDAIARALSQERIARWKLDFEHSALERAAALPAGRPLDLMASYAAPWALALAVTVSGAAPDAAPELNRLAREVFLAAAHRTDPGGTVADHGPTAQLARLLAPADAMIHVQSFVALSQTLPHLLCGAWVELFGRRLSTLPGSMPPDGDDAGASHDRASLAPSGAGALEPVRWTDDLMDELLRLAGPSRAVFRHALADLRIGSASIRAGDRLVLLLEAANRDAHHFREPDRIIPDRDARDHLAFGAGTHGCPGARLTRAAAIAATDALFRTTDAVEIVGPVEWLDGSAIRAPASVTAILRRTSGRSSVRA